MLRCFLVCCLGLLADALAPITNITFVVSSTSTSNCPAGYTKVDSDLNGGAGGKYIYTCYTRDAAAGDPLAKIAIASGKTPSDAVCPAGYTRVSQDLSEGTRVHSDYHYLCLTRSGFVAGSGR